MAEIMTGLGVAAAALTSLSYVPQVRKAWPRNSTDDISWKMLFALTTGLILWIVYGTAKSDWVLAGANAVGALLTGTVLAFKVRDMLSFHHRTGANGSDETSS